ncbi:hypothetical protein BASA81_006474 [Batrachochytrium salamandrivorans]|nr:hypothetical protein BASA81_006474 [Batrachochytrium salamandrivorans]
MRWLIVNADDLGYSQQRDEAIFQAFSQGVVSSASLLVNAKTSQTAALRAMELGLPIGLHLNLTEFAPLSQGVPSLLQADGTFRGKMGIRNSAHLLVEAEVEREIAAQMEKFIALCHGRLPTHVDGHQHVHLLPEICPAFARVLQRFEVRRTRLPVQILTHGNSEFLQQVLSQAKLAKPLLASFGIVHPTHFIGLDLSTNVTLERLWGALGEVPTGGEGEAVIVEYMCHPGKSELAQLDEDMFSKSPDRQNELDLLMDSRLRSVISDEEGFALQSYLCVDALRASPTHKATATKTACILAPLALWTGNQSTALRFRAHLVSFGWRVVLVNSNSVKDFGKVCEFWGVDFVLAIHAFRAGRFLLSCKPALPFVIVLGGTDMNEVNPPPVLEVVRNVLLQAKSVVAFTASLYAKAAAILGNANKICIIPQSVLLPQAATLLPHGSRPWLDTSSPVLLLPLGVRPVKDPLFLIDAVQQYLPQIRMLICGPEVDFDLTAQLKRAIANSRNVFYIGPLFRTELFQAMLYSQFVVNSSISEGQSNTLLEAMSTGTALVVARNNEGNRSVVEDVVGNALEKMNVNAERQLLSELLLKEREAYRQLLLSQV